VSYVTIGRFDLARGFLPYLSSFRWRALCRIDSAITIHPCSIWLAIFAMLTCILSTAPAPTSKIVEGLAFKY